MMEICMLIIVRQLSNQMQSTGDSLQWLWGIDITRGVKLNLSNVYVTDKYCY